MRRGHRGGTMKDTIMNEKTDLREDNMTEDKRKKKKIIAIIIAVILILGAVVAFLIYNNAITAVTMRIQRLVGTVNLYDEEGAEQSLREKMRLGAGQTVTTAGQSLIMVSLDETKLMTMEETSKAEIKTRGKKLLFNLLEGNLFFNVTEKLADNESFDVTTSTMVCGIRGTSAYVGRDATSHEILMVTDGLVHVVATNPVTLETTEVDVPAGQMITIYLDEEAEGNKTISIVMKSFKEEDLPAMALDAIRKSPELLNRVSKATGFSTKKLTTLAELSSTKGVSMYGAAVDELRADGIDDAIPFMGDRSHEMVASANSAFIIAKDDLPLEVAIIQGYRDVMDVGIEAGYDKDSLGQLMNGARGTMEDTFIIVDRAGIRSIDKINIATRVSNTLKVSAGRMSRASLSSDEIADVIEAEKTLITDAVRDSAGDSTDGSKGSDVLASLDKVDEHITGTVDEEMDKSSDGDETVIALLESGKNTRGGKSSSADTEEDEANVTANKPEDTVADADGNTVGTAAGNTAGNANNTNKAAAGSSQKSTGAATSAEIKNARAAIVFTDPNTGVVALADGTIFDPAYYAAANPDVVARYGTSTEALLAEWLAEGKAQGRPPVAPKPAQEAAPVWVANNDQNKSNEPDPYGDDEDDDDDEEEKPKSKSSSTPAAPGSQSNPLSYSNATITVGNANGAVGNYGKEISFNSGTVSMSLPYYIYDTDGHATGTAGTTTSIDSPEDVKFTAGGSATGTASVTYGSTTITHNYNGTSNTYTISGYADTFTSCNNNTPNTDWTKLSGGAGGDRWVNHTTGVVSNTSP